MGLNDIGANKKVNLVLLRLKYHDKGVTARDKTWLGKNIKEKIEVALEKDSLKELKGYWDKLYFTIGQNWEGFRFKSFNSLLVYY